jgi:glucose-6-phosphate 1-dehydrogenase
MLRRPVTQTTQVVILGASGDLTRRMLVPALARIAQKSDDFIVVGVSRRDRTDEAFRAELAQAASEDDAAGFAELAPRVYYQPADVSKPEDVSALAARLDALPGGREAGRLFYLSLAPSLFAPTIEGLGSQQLCAMREDESSAFRRVVIEKPFGHDRASARELNAELHEWLREDQIYRIDHYLGKETVQNLLGFRFHNTIFEPIWNRHYVELVQITVAESIGVEAGRAGYYDGSGAMRDMLQNHMLQLLALVAMEAPVSLEPEAIRSQKVEVLRALHRPDPRAVAESSIRARYAAAEVDGTAVLGYADEEGVEPGRHTETYVALRAEIDSWRWQGVPFLLRHGKRLPKKLTEIQVQFRTPPLALFDRPRELAEHDYRRALRDGSLCRIRPNVLTLSIQPREAITMSFGVKRPGSEMVMTPADLSFDYRDRFDQKPAPAYERLLQDALSGDQTLFLRADEIEACWSFVDDVRRGWESEHAPPLLEYPAGSWGPPEADVLFRGCEGGWSRG